MFGSIGMSELLIILLVVLILFGSKQLPQMARTLGKGWRDIQKAAQNTRDEISKVIDDEDEDELLG